MRSRAHPWWGTYVYQKETAAVRGSRLYLFATPELIDNRVRWHESYPNSFFGPRDLEFLLVGPAPAVKPLPPELEKGFSMGARVGPDRCGFCGDELKIKISDVSLLDDDEKRVDPEYFADLEGLFAPFAGAPHHFKKDK